jgi:hypothetical protein
LRAVFDVEAVRDDRKLGAERECVPENRGERTYVWEDGAMSTADI